MNPAHRLPRIMLFVALLGVMIALPSAAAPRVVVTLLPIHSLVASVMEGVADPQLLIGSNESPHTLQLRPSVARELQRADLLVWVGPVLEGGMSGAVGSLPERTGVIELGSALRRQGEDGDEHGHSRSSAGGSQQPPPLHADEDEGDHHHGDDPHIWLSPLQGAAIARLVAERLIAIDPDHRDRYRANLQRLEQQLMKLDQRMQDRLRPLSDRPFMVFHDAYSALIDRYQLHFLGAVTINPERPPGLRRVHQLRATIGNRQPVCLFSEPQFEPRLVRILTEGTTTRTGILDPLGSNLEPGISAYSRLLEQLADQLLACLAG